MRANARRLARRYLPERVQRSLIAFRGSPTGPTTTGKKAGSRSGEGPARRKLRHEPVLEELRTGGTLATAVVVQVRALLGAGETQTASSIAASLHKEPETATIGALASAIIASDGGYMALAWSEFEVVPSRLWAAHAAREYVRCGLAVDRESTLAAVRTLVVDAPDFVDAKAWTEILGPVFGLGEEDLARDIFAILDRMVGDGTGVDPAMVVTRDWLRPWVAASPDSRSAPPAPDGHVSFAIMDYGHPGRSRASANIGDHIQSLASLGHLVRHQDLAFHGPQDLVDLMEQLHGRVRPEMQRTSVSADIDLMTVDRDASMYVEVPPNTWTLAFGWYMHAIFETRFGFPFHQNLLPIFVSFHCNKRDLLTAEAVEYLREHGPIGCRDWTTVDILLSLEVPAFFSGCLTTTVSTVFPDLAAKLGRRGPVAYVDMPSREIPPGAPKYKHSNDAVRFRSFATNVYNAVDLLEIYRRDCSGLVTTRLHCYLPSRSLGVPVDFEPKNRSDIRFAGLIDITDVEFNRIRDTINHKLERVMSEILSAAAPDDVYASWRTLTQPDVDAARARRAAPSTPHRVAADLPGELARAVGSTRSFGPHPTEGEGEIHVAVHVPTAGARGLTPLLESLVRNTGRGLRVWLISRERGSIDTVELQRLFPGLSFFVVTTKGLGSDLKRADGRPIAERDLDLLVLPELLPAVGRVVVLPADSMATADVAELYEMDLGGHLLAAPTVVGSLGTSGFGAIHAAANRLSRKTVLATELRRQAHARHAFDFDAFSCDVLVLDLAQGRSQAFLDSCLPYVEEFGLTLREVLLFVIGPDRAEIPERWDAVPTRSVLGDRGLVHWADPIKPWDEGYTAHQELWLEVSETVEGRH